MSARRGRLTAIAASVVVAASTAASAATASVPTAAAAAPTSSIAPAARNPFPGPVGGAGLAGAGLVWKPRAGTPAPPNAAATAWMITDLTTHQVLAAKGAHVRLRPASTLKLLTMLTVMPQFSKRYEITATQADADIEGSKVGLVARLPYTTNKLYEAVFLVSANDAVHALTRSMPGGVPGTLAKMNSVAASLGAYDTHPVDPTGLDADGQLSSPYDLTLFMAAGMQRPDFRLYDSEKTANFPLSPHKVALQRLAWKKAHPNQLPPVFPNTYQVQNQNRLLFDFDGTVGGKTGYTTLAQNTYVGVVDRGGHRLVVALMHTKEHSQPQAEALLTWAFAHRTALTPVGQLVTPAQVAAQAKTPGRAVATPHASSAPSSAAAPASSQAAAPAPTRPAHVDPANGHTVLIAVIFGVVLVLLVGLALVFHSVDRRRRRDQDPRRRGTEWV